MDIGMLVAIIGCFVGLAGWLGGRDKNIRQDSEWRGSVNAKLDVIVGIKSDVEKQGETIARHGEKIAEIDTSTKQAHHRIDELKEQLDKPAER